MRIAIYHNLHSGGAKRTLFEEVCRLNQSHHLTLYSLSSADNLFCDVQSSVQESYIYDFQPGKLFRTPWGRLNQLVRLKDLARLYRVNQTIAADIDAAGYDVVLVHPCQFTQGPTLLHFLNTPTVYYCQEPFRRLYDPPQPTTPRAGWRKTLDKIDILDNLYRQKLKKADYIATQKADLVLTNSCFIQQAVHRIYNVNASISYHGVDHETFKQLELPKENMVVSVGALTPNKGFRFIVESLGQIPSARRPKLVIVSNYQEAEERNRLEQLASLHGVHLSCHVMIPNEELTRLYNVAQLVVYAPLKEPFGLVSLEAMACGTPIVAVREGGIPESVVDGHTGFLVERDVQAFAQAVEKLLIDKSLATQLGQQARQHIMEKWTWDKAVQRLETHLQTVTGNTQIRGSLEAQKI